MNLSGLSNSVASVLVSSAKCPRCHAAAQINQGECLNCLLQAGLDDDQASDITTLDALLAEVDVRDTDWRLGNYQILEEIGRGGMGVIYRARQRHSKRIVALKRVLGYHGDSHETLERFRREAEAAASLDHPNILPIFEVSESDGLPFFTMKFATGGSLQYVSPALRDNPRECVRLLAKVARAIGAAHHAGILHRDLKPGNILLDGHGEPMVSDFGLAKWIDAGSDLTRSLAIFGTPGFIAPEQAKGVRSALTPAADVYSLGAILFYLLTGRPPFLGEHALAVIDQAVEKAAPKLRSLVPSAGRDLETICAKCLERDPAARYQSAGALADDLGRWLEGCPIAARPVLPPQRLWRWTRRNPFVASAGLACLLLAAAAITRQLQSAKFEATIREQIRANHSVAVLPFLDLDQATADRTLTSALETELTKGFAQAGPAHVFPAANADALSAGGWPNDIKAAVRDQGARAVLCGTRRAIPGGVRVVLRLVDGDGNLLLRQAIERKDEALAAQIPPGCSAALYHLMDGKELRPSDQVVASKHPTNSAARDLIFAGRAMLEHRTSDDIGRAVDCFRQATKTDAGSALAWASLASGLGIQFHFVPDRTLLDEAEQAAREALKIDPTSPEAHGALAGFYFQNARFSQAKDEGFTAIEEEGPSEKVAGMIGQTWKMTGHPALAIAWLRTLSRGEARPAHSLFILADCWVDLVDDEQAQRIYDHVSQLRADLPEGWLGKCRLRLLERDFAGARQLYLANRDRYKDFGYTREIVAQTEFFARNFPAAEKAYRELEATDPNGGRTFFGAISHSSAFGRLRQLTGHPEEGRPILQESLARERQELELAPNHPEILYCMAAIESSLGEIDSALDHLQAAIDAGWVDYRSTELDPRFDGVADTPRFHQLLDDVRAKLRASKKRIPPLELSSTAKDES